MKPKIELASVVQALTVAEHLSFRRAAESLGVCQSSVSKRVMKLENLLGVDLFDRRHAGVKVTNAGIHFFEQAKLALEYLDVAVESAGMAGRVERGSLKIGIFSSLASGFLPELLRCYSTRHPEIEVNIVEGSPRENLARLRAEQLDITFVMGRAGCARLRCCPVLERTRVRRVAGHACALRQGCHCLGRFAE